MSRPSLAPRTPAALRGSAAMATPAAAKRALSEDQKAELKEAFDLFDSEKTGALHFCALLLAVHGLLLNREVSALTLFYSPISWQNLQENRLS